MSSELPTSCAPEVVSTRLGAWGRVFDVDSVTERAERLVVEHAISSADALQLRAALVTFEDRPRNRGFVVVDSGLARAARDEGFEVFGPSA